MDMTMILGGVVLPRPKPEGFQRIFTPNETDNITLGGRLYTDFINNRRSWQVTWDNLKLTDYNTIYALYLKQYQTSTYNVLQFDAMGVYGPVKMQISPQKPKFNNTLVGDFSIILIEQNSFS